jgi:hypothetical protein
MYVKTVLSRDNPSRIAGRLFPRFHYKKHCMASVKLGKIATALQYIRIHRLFHLASVFDLSTHDMLHLSISVPLTCCICRSQYLLHVAFVDLNTYYMMHFSTSVPLTCCIFGPATTVPMGNLRQLAIKIVPAT